MLWKGKNSFRHIELIPGGVAIGFGSYNTLGRTYFVNNITGHSNRDGLTWKNAFAQPSQAIIASEVYRQARGDVSTNDYIRNTIVIQGTGVVYESLTSLPQYCDIIGLGTRSNSSGFGIARIGELLKSGISGGASGLNLYNIQFKASGPDKWCADFTQLLSSVIEDCCFKAYSDNMPGGMRFTGSSGGLQIIRNTWGRGKANTGFNIGLQIEGANFDHCLVEDNFINGRLRGIKVLNSVHQCNSTLVRHNVIGDIDGSGCNRGVEDLITGIGHWARSGPIYVENHIIAGGIATLVEGRQTRWVGNTFGAALTDAEAG